MSGPGARDGFRAGCIAGRLKPGDGPVVVGISGGCDSIVLGQLLLEAGFELVVVHVNHGIRHDAADDETFVTAWCQQSNVTCHVAHPPDDAPSTGVQAWARRVRYQAFLKAAEEHGARSVVLAHHADDQLETQLLNLERGTGMAGLAGMRVARPFAANTAIRVVRPLLRISRQEIEQLAAKEDWAWVEDPSNNDVTYTRNAIRRELDAMTPAARNAFRAAGAHLANRVNAIRNRIITGLSGLTGSHGTELPFEDVDPLPGWLQEWVLLEWVNMHAPGVPRRSSIAREVMALRDAQVGRRAEFGNAVIWRERSALRITYESGKADAPVAAVPLPRAGESARVEFCDGRFSVESLTPNMAPSLDSVANDPYSALIDGDALGPLLTIRSWKPGDRFQPLGMAGTKKLKSYLTDLRVPPSHRAQVPVVLSGDTLVWVVGYGIAHDLRIVKGTTRWVRLKWESLQGQQTTS